MITENPHFTRYLEALKASVFFQNVPVNELRLLLANMTVQSWEAKTFHNSTEIATTLHFIVSGRLKVFKMHPDSDRGHTIFLLSGGDVFDVLSLMDTESHDVQWEALDDIELLSIKMETMHQWIQNTPLSHIAILNYLGHRMRILEEAASNIALHNTLVRLSSLLLMYINGTSHKLELINTLPNKEIAELIGTTRAVVNRHIQELKHCGAISVKRKQIDVENLQLLIAIAHEKYIL